MIKLVIFDLDGTLLDTIEDLANATNHALKQFNFPVHEVASYRFFVGNGVNKLLERALPEAHKNADAISMLKHEFLKYYLIHAEDCTKPYPGIPELLTKLYKAGYQLAVASNKMHEATIELVGRFFPGISFTTILGQREGIPVKPSPAIVDEIVECAGVTKSETLYVGDSGVDAATSLNAGVPFVGVLWGFRPQQELEAAGATRFVEKPEEIEKLVG
ncbi:MAG: HAD family hydrolase [Paludibacter sp.]|nr:HAD family hydrolase [Paludibacter sp.]